MTLARDFGVAKLAESFVAFAFPESLGDFRYAPLTSTWREPVHLKASGVSFDDSLACASCLYESCLYQSCLYESCLYQSRLYQSRLYKLPMPGLQARGASQCIRIQYPTTNALLAGACPIGRP